MVESVLVPVDIEHPQAWEKARRALVELFGGKPVALHILYVVPRFEQSIVGSFFPEDFEERATEAAKTALADLVSGADLGGLGEPKLHVSHGTVYEQVLSAADKLGVSLIVVGAHKPELSDFLLGTNAANIARHAKQSVLVLR